MTMTIQPGSSKAVVDPRTRAGLAGLVVSAVLLALGRLMTTPGGGPAERLQQMSGTDVRVTASALLTILGFVALVLGLLTVVARIRGRGATLATVAGGLVALGGVGMSVLTAVDLSTLAATRAGPDSAMRDYLHQLDVSPGILGLTPVAVIGYLIGPFLVTLAARRAAFVPRWLPWATLGVLLLQPVAAGAGGPAVTRVVDAVFQVMLVALFWVLARCTLAHAEQEGASAGRNGRAPTS
ncbi:hypothetical protein [Nocardioides sp. YIM 152315]|uniref:hypothetical protein n=1 Tax=Nocardioides sp. YIM 152315 TaxID=3031760 RepID=UPI0023DB7814|nr:hypothetical protein [Nocardioides sp. YIM 152315]MDF1605429.1 hypothetical protein [Nocardioides sp. YIM 152315]